MTYVILKGVDDKRGMGEINQSIRGSYMSTSWAIVKGIVVKHCILRFSANVHTSRVRIISQGGVIFYPKRRNILTMVPFNVGSTMQCFTSMLFLKKSILLFHSLQ
jgi:hypothetical protein